MGLKLCLIGSLALPVWCAAIPWTSRASPDQTPSVIFNVRDYGAVGDGVTLDTPGLNKAVAACAAAGGGQVLVPPGRYLSGTIHLQSRVRLYLAAGASLIGPASHLIIRDSATGVCRAAASVESWAEAPWTNVVFRDVTIEYKGGGTADQGRQLVKAPGVHARPLPAWALYARHVQNLVLDQVRLRSEQEDLRPVLIADRVGRLALDDLKSPVLAHRPETMILTESRFLWLKPGQKSEVLFEKLTAPAAGTHRARCGDLSQNFEVKP